MIHLLAASNSNPMNVIFGIIVFAIWILGGLASSAGKKKDKERRDRIREAIERERNLPAQRVPQIPQTPPALPRLSQVQAKRIERPVSKPVPLQSKTRKLPPAPKLMKVPLPPIPLSSPVPAAPTKGHLPVEATAIAVQTARTAVPATPLATAATLRSWMRPATLRQQFILTEILQPPLSLRDPQ